MNLLATGGWISQPLTSIALADVSLLLQPLADVGILQDDTVKTRAADNLAPCVTRSPTAVALAMCDKQIIVFSGAFQPHVPFQSKETV